MGFSLTLGVLLLAVSVLVCAGNDTCCIPESSTCMCNQMNLSSIPSCIPSNASHILLSQNVFTVLNSATMGNTTFINCTTLQLTLNPITMISPGAFALWPKLGSLYIGLSLLTTITSSMFEGLTQLTNLVLDWSPIATLMPQAFSSLPLLSSVSLKGSRLTSLNPGVFNGSIISSITLDSSTMLTSIQSGALAGLTMLTLSLQDTGLTGLSPSMFEGKVLIVALYLNLSPISDIANNTFEGMTSIQTLDMDGSSLTELNAGMLSGLTGLTYLYLGTIAPGGLQLAPDFVNLTSPELIDLELSIGLKEITPDLFPSTLATLSLAFNPITSIAAYSFSSLRNLSTLNLTGLPEVMLSPFAFDGLSSTAKIIAGGSDHNPIYYNATRCSQECPDALACYGSLLSSFCCVYKPSDCTTSSSIFKSRVFIASVAAGAAAIVFIVLVVLGRAYRKRQLQRLNEAEARRDTEITTPLLERESGREAVGAGSDVGSEAVHPGSHAVFLRVHTRDRRLLRGTGTFLQILGPTLQLPNDTPSDIQECPVEQANGWLVTNYHMVQDAEVMEAIISSYIWNATGVISTAVRTLRFRGTDGGWRFFSLADQPAALAADPTDDPRFPDITALPVYIPPTLFKCVSISDQHDYTPSARARPLVQAATFPVWIPSERPNAQLLQGKLTSPFNEFGAGTFSGRDFVEGCSGALVYSKRKYAQLDSPHLSHRILGIFSHRFLDLTLRRFWSWSLVRQLTDTADDTFLVVLDPSLDEGPSCLSSAQHLAPLPDLDALEEAQLA
eukprot:m.860187 g.860187  ORF g.860187 m.860187 type:complete len:784 (+) comp59674_c0_seq21:2928-5279(+)